MVVGRKTSKMVVVRGVQSSQLEPVTAASLVSTPTGNTQPAPVLRSRSRLELPLLGRRRSRFFCWSEPGSKKQKPCSCVKHNIKSSLEG